MIVTATKESFDELKMKLKKNFPSLSDSDLKIRDNDEKMMLTLVAYKLRKSKAEMSEIIERL
jgi:hypothetical protein